MNNYNIGGTPYGFSACGLEELGSSEYTLVGIAVDDSSSVGAFASELEACVKRVVSACRSSPRSDNLLIRVVRFASNLEEVHGFKPLGECVPRNYDNLLGGGGMTALHDACVNVVESVARYGRTLQGNGFEANAVVFVLTDGGDNASTATPQEVKKAVGRAMKQENLESALTVLVGVNTDASGGLSGVLKDLTKAAAFDHYVNLNDASESTLAGLAAFVSRSISQQSRMLGSGHKPHSLRF